MSKLIISLLFAAISIFYLIALNHSKPAAKTKEELVVGTQSGYPPFEFFDASGNLVGFDIDVAKLIAEKIGKLLIFHDMDFEAEILSLKQGKIDLIMSGMNITSSRMKEIDMVPYHGEATKSLSLIFWKEQPAEIHTLKDLADYPVSVQSGSVSETYLKHFPEIQAKSFQGTLAPLMDVKFGKSLANLVESDVAEYLQTQHPEIKILNVPLPEEEIILGFGIGIKKDKQQLFQEIKKAVQELKDSGQLQQLEDRWFKGVQDGT